MMLESHQSHTSLAANPRTDASGQLRSLLNMSMPMYADMQITSADIATGRKPNSERVSVATGHLYQHIFAYIHPDTYRYCDEAAGLGRHRPATAGTSVDNGD